MGHWCVALLPKASYKHLNVRFNFVFISCMRNFSTTTLGRKRPRNDVNLATFEQITLKSRQKYWSALLTTVLLRFQNYYQTIWSVLLACKDLASAEKSNFILVEYVDISRSLPKYWLLPVQGSLAASKQPRSSLSNGRGCRSFRMPKLLFKSELFTGWTQFSPLFSNFRDFQTRYRCQFFHSKLFQKGKKFLHIEVHKVGGEVSGLVSKFQARFVPYLGRFW